MNLEEMGSFSTPNAIIWMTQANVKFRYKVEWNSEVQNVWNQEI